MMRSPQQDLRLHPVTEVSEVKANTHAAWDRSSADGMEKLPMCRAGGNVGVAPGDRVNLL